MGDRSRTADGRRRWRQWTEGEARAALAEIAESGESPTSFARRRGVSPNRLRYWTRRLGMEPSVPSFVQLHVPASGTAQDVVRIEVVVGEVVVRVQKDIEVSRLAAIVRALAGREPAC